MAASAATIVAMAASPGKLIIAPNARMMIHRAWNIAIGNMHEMQATANNLEQLDGQIAAMYAKRTGRRPATMLAVMDAETYYTGEEAVAEGFADRVANEPSAMNAPRRGKELHWLRVPADLEVEAAGPDDDPSPEERTGWRLRWPCGCGRWKSTSSWPPTEPQKSIRQNLFTVGGK